MPNVLQDWNQWAQKTVADAERSVGIIGADPTLTGINKQLMNVQAGLFGPGKTGPEGGATIESGLFGMSGTLEHTEQLALDTNMSITNPTDGLGAMFAGINNILSALASFAGDFGFLPTATALSEIWGDFADFDAGNASGLLYAAGVSGKRDELATMTRAGTAPMFLCWFDGNADLGDVEFMPNLQNIDPSMQNPGESDIDFLNRVAPTFTWIYGLASHPTVGYLHHFPSGGTAYFFYYPVGLSAYPFKRLWDYTPVNGPPVRNAIDDFVAWITLIPLRW